VNANGQQQAPAPQVDTAKLLGEQTLLTRLGLHDLRQRWAKQTPRSIATFGEGEPAERTIHGNPQDAFHGLVVLNRTGKTVSVGFAPGQGLGSPLTVPPGSALVWAAEFANVSLAAPATGPVEEVVVLRLYYPPAQPMVFPFIATKASSTHEAPEDITVKEASVQLLPANPARLGMEIIDRGEKAVRLALGEAAKQKHGLWLAATGGSWNGQLSGALWLGSVAAICDAGETAVAVVEA
jgi:hypothetical protein